MQLLAEVSNMKLKGGDLKVHNARMKELYTAIRAADPKYVILDEQ